MKVESFRFHSRATGWELEDAKFEAFNLLVGVSGVGKSRILLALRQVQQVATDRPHRIHDGEWAIAFEHDGHRYSWNASVAAEPQGDSEGDIGEARGNAAFISELIIKDGETLVERDGKSFHFEGKLLPRLKRTDCAITLLAEEPSISPLRKAFSSFIFSVDELSYVKRYSRQSVDASLARHTSVEQLRDAGDTFPLLKAYLLQEIAPAEWATIKELFIGIFPSVEDLRVERSQGEDPEFDVIDLCLRERGVGHWIRTHDISSGMRRTLVHLIDIFLAPPGSVIAIDEFENSLGKNCMPALTDFILSRAPDLQFFITSHHPYIINKIPIDTWKLVRRQGSRVRLLSARDIPALQEASHHEAFDRLLNLPEFEEGIE